MCVVRPQDNNNVPERNAQNECGALEWNFKESYEKEQEEEQKIEI